MVNSAEVITNTFGDRYLPEINGDLFKNRPASEVFARHSDPDLFREDCFHIVVGSDSGLLVDYILQKGIPAGSTYLCIEPESVYRKLESLLPQPGTHKRLAMGLPDNWLDVAQPLDLETYILKKQVLIHPCQASKQTASNLYQPLLDRIFNELDAAAYAVKSPYIIGTMTDTMLANISENILPVNTLYGKFGGRTAIILGAGPSLDQHLDWIRAHRTQLIIIAVSRLCKRLLKEQITPDIVISVDSQDINYELSNALFEFPPETVLVHSDHVSPRLTAQWHGYDYYIGNLLPWPSPLNIDNMQEEGGPTVANSALVLAGKLGFETILLSGVDLCSPIGQNSHAGSHDLKGQQQQTHQVETYRGDMAKTNVQMFHAANILREQAAEITQSEVINLSPFACKIEHIQHQPSEQVELGENTDNNWRECLQYPELEIRVEHNKKVLDLLQKARLEVKTINKLVEDAKAFNKKVYKKDSEGNYNLKANKKLNNIKQRLEQEFEHFTLAIKNLGIDYFVAAMTTRDVFQFDDQQLEQLNFKYYDAYSHGGKALVALLDSSIQRIRSRIEEDEASPQLEKLAQQWRTDRQPGRGKVWSYRHPDKLAELSELDTAILSELKEELGTHFRPLDFPGPRHNQAWILRQYLENIYQQGDIAELNSAEDRLNDPLIDSSRAAQLASVIQLYRELLNKRPDLALPHFQNISRMDYSEPLLLAVLAEALGQANISIIDTTFQALCARAPHYQPEYANWLKLNNRIVEAADIYTRYLQQAPEDINTWVALAALYRDAGEADMAKAVYSYVLEWEPENPEAKAFMNP